MPIYSGNSYSSVGNLKLEADSRYYNSTVGEILSESVINDSNIFAAMVASDMNEIAVRYEGTLLEVEAINSTVKRIKSAFDKIKENIKKFFKKLQSLLDAAIVNVVGYLGKDLGKKAGKYKKVIEANDAKLSNIRLTDFRQSVEAEVNFGYLNTKINELTDLSKDNSEFTNMSRTDMVNKLVSEVIGKGNKNAIALKNAKTVKHSTMDKLLAPKANTTVGNAVYDCQGHKGVKGLIAACEASGPSVKDLRDTKKKIDRTAKLFIAKLDRGEKEILKQSEKGGKGKNTYTTKIDGQTLDASAISKYRDAASIIQDTSGTLVKGIIAARKFEIKRNARVLSMCITKLTGKQLSEGYIQMVGNTAFNEAGEELDKEVDPALAAKADDDEAIIDSTPETDTGDYDEVEEAYYW